LVGEVGEEAEEGETWGRVAEPLIKASSLGIDASCVGFGLLRHCEGLVV
jgi:hypothetical protein